MFFSQLDFNCNYTPGADISRLGSTGPSICIHCCVAASPSSSMFKGRKLDESLPARSEAAQTTKWRKIHNNTNIIIGYNCYYDYNYVYATHCAFLHVSSTTGYTKKGMKHKTRKIKTPKRADRKLYRWFVLRSLIPFHFPSRTCAVAMRQGMRSTSETCKQTN